MRFSSIHLAASVMLISGMMYSATTLAADDLQNGGSKGNPTNCTKPCNGIKAVNQVGVAAQTANKTATTTGGTPPVVTTPPADASKTPSGVKAIGDISGPVRPPIN